MLNFESYILAHAETHDLQRVRHALRRTRHGVSDIKAARLDAAREIIRARRKAARQNKGKA